MNRLELLRLLTDKKNQRIEVNIEIDMLISMIFKRLNHRLTLVDFESFIANEVESLRAAIERRDKIEKELRLIQDSYNQLIEKKED
jgi:hypothetical protein